MNMPEKNSSDVREGSTYMTTDPSSPSKSPDKPDIQPVKKKTNRPPDIRILQQNLRAWKASLTPLGLSITFIIHGFLFIIIGSVLTYYSNSVKEKVIDYTDCISASDGVTRCSQLASSTYTCTCTIDFSLNSDFENKVYIYYGLDRFYQNHRLYSKSRDDNQLLGAGSVSVMGACSPYDNPDSTKVYAPCGVIANSIFNDSFSFTYYGATKTGSGTAISLENTGIAWESDVFNRYGNPASWTDTVKPKSWSKNVYQLDTTDATNNGYKNQDLIVWMRTAALPKFRKLYRIKSHGLSAGYYKVTISYNFPTNSYSGRKEIYISTVTWMGGKNLFVGVAFLVAAFLSLILGVLFFIAYLIFECGIIRPLSKKVIPELKNTNLNDEYYNVALSPASSFKI